MGSSSRIEYRRLPFPLIGNRMRPNVGPEPSLPRLAMAAMPFACEVPCGKDTDQLLFFVRPSAACRSTSRSCGLGRVYCPTGGVVSVGLRLARLVDLALFLMLPVIIETSWEAWGSPAVSEAPQESAWLSSPVQRQMRHGDTTSWGRGSEPRALL